MCMRFLNSPFFNQFKFPLYSQGIIEPFCELLTLLDSKIIQVALNGLENILKLGEEEAKRTG